MSKNVCGYPAGKKCVDDEGEDGGGELSVSYGVVDGCVDVGRDEDGEVRSFCVFQPEVSGQIAHPSQPTESPLTPPRLFDPTFTFPTPVSESNTADRFPASEVSALAKIQMWSSELVVRARRNIRRPWLVGMVGVSVVLLFVAVMPAGYHAQTTLPATSAAPQPNASVDSSPLSDGTDPQASAIDLALNGAISGLGSMQGVPRTSVSAVVASRAGEIVLVDVSVTKPTGLTAFATVLLQKVGTQWRMRQVVDGRN